MKPQCNTSADCLRELARVMDQFGFSGINSAVESKYVKSSGVDKYTEYFTTPTSWQFAIAEVEGKPVFIGDELYTPCTGKTTALDFNGSTIAFSDGSYELPSQCSWNPPKPATVMVELPYDYARNRAAQNCTPDATLVNACKTALEKLK